MTEDKAIEKIKQYFGVAIRYGHNHNYFDLLGTAKTLLNDLERLGYRKVTEDMLLTQDELITVREQVEAQDHTYTFSIIHAINCAIAQAQYNKIRGEGEITNDR